LAENCNSVKKGLILKFVKVLEQRITYHFDFGSIILPRLIEQRVNVLCQTFGIGFSLPDRDLRSGIGHTRAAVDVIEGLVKMSIQISGTALNPFGILLWKETLF